MAEDTQKATSEAAPPATAEVVATPETEVKVEKPPVPEPEKPVEVEVQAKPEEKEKAEEKVEEVKEAKKITQSSSFKEESNVAGELPDSQKKALEELKQLVQEALNKHEFTAKEEEKKEAEKPVEEEKKEEKVSEAPAGAQEPKTEESKIEEPKAEEKSAAEPTKTEESKPEEKSAVEPLKSEVPKTEEKPAEEPAKTGEPKAEDKSAKAEETPKEKAETETPAPPAELKAATEQAVVISEVAERTVEAIEESVVSVSATASEPPAEPKEAVVAAPPPPPEEVSIWGIPLLVDERSDVVLLKFLRARDFKVKDAFTMLKNTVRWRKEFGIDALLDEDLGNDWDKVVFTQGTDKEGHPVFYNVYGEFMNKELYQNTFSDEEKRTKFIKWFVQSLEKSIRKLDFSPTGICTFVQVNDLRNSPGLFKRELKQTTDKALQLLQDNYPEFVAKQVFINVPLWYVVFYTMISPFLTQRSKSKFVVSGPAKSPDTLFKYIAPEQVPVQYGGLNMVGEQEFTTADSVTEVTIKPGTKHTIELPATEKCNLVWELRVLGWDVSYGAEFVPSAEGAYTVIVQKSRKVTLADEPVISNSFKVGEPGKIVLTVDNQSSKKKKLLYRSKIKPYSD